MSISLTIPKKNLRIWTSWLSEKSYPKLLREVLLLVQGSQEVTKSLGIASTAVFFGMSRRELEKVSLSALLSEVS